MRSIVPGKAVLIVVLALAAAASASAAHATELIRFAFTSNGDRADWIELQGKWTVTQGKYVGTPGRDPQAVTGYVGPTGPLSTVVGDVALNTPADGVGYVIARAKADTAEDGKSTVISGYFLGLMNRAGVTRLRIVKSDAAGTETVLCNKNLRLKDPTGLVRLVISVSGSVFVVKQGEVECRGFDRAIATGAVGFLTRGGSNKSRFKVDFLDFRAK